MIYRATTCLVVTIQDSTHQTLHHASFTYTIVPSFDTFPLTVMVKVVPSRSRIYFQLQGPSPVTSFPTPHSLTGGSQATVVASCLRKAWLLLPSVELRKESASDGGT